MVTEDPGNPDHHDHLGPPPASGDEAERPAGLRQGASRSLARLMIESPKGLDARRVIGWADQLARVVDDLHERGLSHGDICPSMVVVDEADEASLIDAPTERDLLLGDAGTREPRPAGRRAQPARGRRRRRSQTSGGSTSTSSKPSPQAAYSYSISSS